MNAALVARSLVLVAACGGSRRAARTTEPRQASRTGVQRHTRPGTAASPGGPTASGERFDKHAMTAAHRTLPLGTRVRVTNQRNGKSVDRADQRSRSVRQAAASSICRRRRRDELDMIDAGVVPVTRRGDPSDRAAVDRARRADEAVRRDRRARSGVDATIDGKIIGLLGPNGAGKSTLLKACSASSRSRARARVLGLVGGDARRARSAIASATCRSRRRSSSGMSAVELCTYAGELSGLPRTEAMQRAHAALYYAGLEEKRYQPIDGYSTGMKQRVKLAQALVHDPEILFLDEPTNGLDPRSREEMLELIAELPERRGCAIVLSTHLLPDVERVCDHAVIMHQGRVRFVGTIDELRGARGRDTELVVEVKAEPTKLADGARPRAGATCEVSRRCALAVDLPAERDDASWCSRARARPGCRSAASRCGARASRPRSSA